MSSSSKDKDPEVLVNGVPDGSKRLDQLPAETLQNIISHVDANDLLTIQTLSRQFQHLASAEIYRDLGFSITSAETDDRGDVASRAADAMQTINTSEYDYAQHVKSFRLGREDHVGSPTSLTLNYSDPHILTRVVFDSKSDASKFLNSAILQMVRKASILETFRWNIPLELSGTVYQALHKISSLRHLHVRLDITPAPKLVSRSPYPNSHAPPPPPGITQPPLPPNPSNLIVPQTHSLATRPIVKRKKTGGSTFWANQRSFSGFKTLTTLELVRLASLDCLSEMSQCIRACSASLKTLTVTLDQQFAVGARKPPSSAQADLDSLSDTELEEDEMLFGPMSPTGNGQQATGEVDSRQVKTLQEGILASLFDLENSAAKGSKLEQKLGLPGGRCLVEEDQNSADTKLKDLMKTLDEIETSEDQPKLSEIQRLGKYRMIRDLANLYLQKNGPRLQKAPKADGKKPIAPKKPYKSSKTNIAKYPSVPPDNLLDDFDFSEFLALQSPPSPNKSWPMVNTSGIYDDPYEGMPPELFHGSASSPLSIPPPLPYTTASKSSLDPLPPLPYSSSFGPPGINKTPSYIDSTIPPPYPNPSNLYTDPIVKQQAYAKHLINKKKATKKAGTSYLSSSKESVVNNNFPHLQGLSPKKYEDLLKQATSQAEEEMALAIGKPLSVYGNSKVDPIPAKKAKAVKNSSLSSSPGTGDDFNLSSQYESQGQTFFAADPNQAADEEIDVDMDHPDADQSDFIDEQESRSSTDTEAQSPRKRMKPLEIGESSSAVNDDASISATPPKDGKDVKMTDAEKMHEYVRTTHGIQLEELRLHLIPIKASIVGKALDLTVLQRITLLETGPQDAFWALLVKLTSSEAPISFKSIHTDNVSLSFLRYLSTFKTLEQLFMHQRKAKNSDVDSEGAVDITSIRKQALRPHVKSLRKLMLRNEANDTWDIDNKTLNLLALQANQLEELGINLKSYVYHNLLQIFPVFRSLRALHLIILRGSDRNNYFMQIESLAYTIDSLAHCPDLSLKYIAIADNVMQLTGHQHFRNQLKKLVDNRAATEPESRWDKKGKGKAVDAILMDVDEASDNDSDEKLGNIKFPKRWSGVRIARRLSDIKDVRIFSTDHRTGKL